LPPQVAPVANCVQVPFDPARTQEKQLPAHAVSQQVPPTQWPDMQPPSTVHCIPFCTCVEHLPPKQSSPVAQPELPAQLDGQPAFVPSQT
jgi:hypothetical protein